MVFGMTMIKVSSGQERSVYAHLQKRPEVRDVYRLFGEYSFFLVMQAEERNGLSRMLSEVKLRRRTRAASCGASEAPPHENGSRLS